MTRGETARWPPATLAPTAGDRCSGGRAPRAWHVRLAWASLDRSSIARAIWWREADVDDRYRFPARTIPAGEEASPLPAGADIDLSSAPLGAGGSGGTFDGLLRETDTLAFVVVDEDRVVYERYFNGAGRQQRQTSFSVAKSFLSALVGIAIDASNPIRRDG